MSNWKCGNCGEEYSTSEFLLLKKAKMNEEDIEGSSVDRPRVGGGDAPNAMDGSGDSSSMIELFNNKYCRVDHVCYDDQSSCEFVLDYDKVVLAVEELKQWKPDYFRNGELCDDCDQISEIIYEHGDAHLYERLCCSCLYKRVFGSVKK